MASQYGALNDSNTLVLLTEWKVLRLPDFKEMKTKLYIPVIFDGRNHYIAYDLNQKGIEYCRIGRK